MTRETDTDDGADDDHAPARPACQACGGWLDLAQPDVLNPERLVGVCIVCRAWIAVSGSAVVGPIAVDWPPRVGLAAALPPGPVTAG